MVRVIHPEKLVVLDPRKAENDLHVALNNYGRTKTVYQPRQCRRAIAARTQFRRAVR